MRQNLTTRGATKTRNLAGGQAYSVDAKTTLYLTVCTSLLEDKFYETSASELTRIRELVKQSGVKFTLQLATYARREMNLRTVAVVLLAEAVRLQSMSKGKAAQQRADEGLIRSYVPRILARADEPSELVAYWRNSILVEKGKGRRGPATFPAALKKGISDALNQWDEYQLAKHDHADRQISLKDVFKLCHPKPLGRKDGRWTPDDRRELYDRIVHGKMKTPETWEVEVNAAAKAQWKLLGIDQARADLSKAEFEAWKKSERRQQAIRGIKGKAYDDLAERGKLGIFALARNLRNFVSTGASVALNAALSAITDPEQVAKSRMLPFRWMAADQVLAEIHNPVLRNEIADALEVATELSIQNVPEWPGRTIVLGDNSGSMDRTISARSKISRKHIAGLMASIVFKRSKGARLGVFATHFKWVDVRRRDSILTNAKVAASTYVDHSTFAHKAIEQLIRERVRADRVFLFSDLQCYTSNSMGNRPAALQQYWSKYKREVSPNAVLYSVDLAGYGTSQFAQGNQGVHLLAGWSERIFDLVPRLESGGNAIDKIEAL